MSETRELGIIVYGATGYTGRLVWRVFEQAVWRGGGRELGDGWAQSGQARASAGRDGYFRRIAVNRSRCKLFVIGRCIGATRSGDTDYG